MTSKSKIQYIANGQNTVYETPFSVYIQTGVEVYFDDVKIEPQNYSVSLDAQKRATITFNSAPANGVVITLNRVLPVLRTSSFQEGGSLRASTLNYEFDYQMACLQDVSEIASRSMAYPPYATSSDVDLTLPSPEAGKSIVWTPDGMGLENSNVVVNDLEETLNEYKNTAQQAANTAIEKANLASTKADAVMVATDGKADADFGNTNLYKQLSGIVDLNNLTSNGIFNTPYNVHINTPIETTEKSTWEVSVNNIAGIIIQKATPSTNNFGYGCGSYWSRRNVDNAWSDWKPVNGRILVQSYSSGKNWYKVYQETRGIDDDIKYWCEQSFNITKSSSVITQSNLLKNMIDTNYSIFVVRDNNHPTDAIVQGCSYSTSQISTKTNQNGDILRCYVVGYCNNPYS